MDQLSQSDRARLHSMDALDYAEDHRELYLYIARRLLESFPDMTNVEDRIECIATFIERMDKDIFGIERGDFPLKDLCKLLAKTVIGHEAEGADTTANE